MKKLVLLVAIFAGVVSGCDMLSNHIWTEYIWKVEKKHFDTDRLDTGLPVVRIDTEGRGAIKSRENYLNAVFSISGTENGACDLNLPNMGDAAIRGRGNTTWWHPKKPYRIKFDKKQALFGHKAAKSWVLLANHQDPTLMMNTIAFELGHRMGLPFTNHAHHVELVLNGVYEGSYVLTEQVQVGDGRVEIGEKKGFLVELDSYYDEEPKFTSAYSRLPVMIKSPEPEDVTLEPGNNFVEDSINKLDSLLFADDFPENGYRDLIDTDTFVTFLIINEVVGNSELSFPKSAYMYYNNKTGKICLGPLWDFDGAFSYGGGGENIYFKNSNYRISMHPFFKRFFDDPEFKQLYQDTWNTYYNDIKSIEDFIDDTAGYLDASQRANFTVWRWLNNPNYGNEVSKMKSWWKARISYLDAEINGNM